MIKKAILAAVALAGVCAVGMALLRPEWLPFVGPSARVRARAEGYWNARVAGDAKALAPFAHPLQKTQPEGSTLATDSFEITSVAVNGDEATVSLKAKYRVRMPQMRNIEREVSHEETWVRYENQWYRALHPVGLGEVLSQGLGKWKPPTEAKP
jgi:hypothetical protein